MQWFIVHNTKKQNNFTHYNNSRIKSIPGKNALNLMNSLFLIKFNAKMY